jgi:hypothetical protein
MHFKQLLLFSTLLILFGSDIAAKPLTKKEALTILELREDYTKTVLNKAYRTMALKFHPDKWAYNGLSQSEAAEKFKELGVACDLLWEKFKNMPPMPSIKTTVDVEQEDENIRKEFEETWLYEFYKMQREARMEKYNIHYTENSINTYNLLIAWRKKDIKQNKNFLLLSKIFKYLDSALCIGFLYAYKKKSDKTFKKLITEIQKQKITEEDKKQRIKKAHSLRYLPNRQNYGWLIGITGTIGFIAFNNWFSKFLLELIKSLEIEIQNFQADIDRLKAKKQS